MSKGLWQWIGPGRGNCLCKGSEGGQCGQSMVSEGRAAGDKAGDGQGRLTWQVVKSTGKDAGFMLSEMGFPLKGFREESSVWLLEE